MDNEMMISSPIKKKKLLGKWRWANYGLLGLFETIIRLFAFGVGIASLIEYDRNESPDNGYIQAQAIMLICLTVIYLGLLVQRVLDGELQSILVMIIQIAVHIIVIFVLYNSNTDMGDYLFAFSFILIVADFVRMMWLFIDDQFKTRFLIKPILYALSLLFIIIYVVILILQIIIYTTVFNDE